MFSSTELLPLDCDPTTAICGRSIGFCTYRGSVSASWSPSRVRVPTTYADCGEDILQLVNEGDEARVVDVDPRRFSDASMVSGGAQVVSRVGVRLRHCWLADALVAQ